MPHLLSKRLVFVVGKGGVGRSTVAAALGLVAARRGRRTIVAEVAGQDQVSQALAGRAADRFVEHQLEAGLWAISIDPQHATREYLEDQLPVRAMAHLLAESSTFAYFAAAAPGLHELVTIGKIWELTQPDRRTHGADPYDLVIVDAPASGHAVAIMRTPRTFAEIARVGPVARQARRIDGDVSDERRTGVVAVALPADMPVNETLQLNEALHDQLGLGFDRVVVNGLYPRRFTGPEAGALREALAPDGADAAGRAALRAALSEHERATAQRREVRRLARGLDAKPIELPFLFDPELSPGGVARLAGRLEAAL